jgi:NAD(P)-dependent dehydrogenase (short-subunit alcohol dehydrogenase family)
MRSPSEIFTLEGRTALVTGGNRGLGRTFARALASAGARVLITASNAESLALARSEFSSEGISVETFAADISQREQIERLVQWATRESGVDILVANAGVSETERLTAFTDSAMDRLIAVNLLAPMLLTRLLVPHMKENKWGRLIYLSSVAAFVSSETDGHSIYSATKSGLNGFMRTAALELGSYGITANCIAPGTFLTDMARDVLESYGEQGKVSYDRYAKMNALHRWGNVEELEGPMLLLASGAGSFITGSVVMVDGGFTVRSTPAQ